MAKTSMIRVRIEPELKSKVEAIFSDLGLSQTEAITLFYNQVRLNDGLPFDVVIPNKTTTKTFQDTDNNKNIVECTDTEDMFEKLNI